MSFLSKTISGEFLAQGILKYTEFELHWYWWSFFCNLTFSLLLDMGRSLIVYLNTGKKGIGIFYLLKTKWNKNSRKNLSEICVMIKRNELDVGQISITSYRLRKLILCFFRFKNCWFLYSHMSNWDVFGLKCSILNGQVIEDSKSNMLTCDSFPLIYIYKHTR